MNSQELSPDELTPDDLQRYRIEISSWPVAENSGSDHFWLSKVSEFPGGTMRTSDYIIHSVEEAESLMTRLVHEAIVESGSKMDGNECLMAPGSVQRFTGPEAAVTLDFSPCYTEEQMIAKGLIDAPDAGLGLDPAAWGGIIKFPVK